MNKLLTAATLALALGAGGPAFAQNASSSGGATPSRDAAPGAAAGGPSARDAEQPATGSDATRSSTAAAAGSSGAANAMMGMKVQELIGRDVVNAAGKDVGEIDDIVVNDQDQAVYAVVGVGGFLGFGGKDVAIPFDQLRLGAENVILMSEKGEDQLKEMPSYKKGQWKSIEPSRAIDAR